MIYYLIKLKTITRVGVILSLLFFTTQAVFAQNIAVTGTVVDAKTGEELIGVNVIQKGTSNGVATDINGNFTLNVPGNATLVVRYVGYRDLEVSVSNNTKLSIQLEEDTKLLDEVVVVGYGTQKRSEITAAVSSLKEDDFATTAAPSNILELAKGRIAGLIITNPNGGDPRSNPSIQIRGTSSMRGSNEPLIVLDGIPVDVGALSLVPPEDVESFSVLKDGSGAAIYGTRGANGVILVTTKGGRSTGDLKPTFDYSATIWHDYVYNRPDIMTSQQYRNYMQSGGHNANMMVDYGADTDWMGLLTNKNNVSHTHNLSMTGGTRATNYRASVFFRDVDPIAIRSNQQSWGVRGTINHLGLNDRLQVNVNISTNVREWDNVMGRGEWEQVAQRNPTGPAKDENGDWMEDGAYNSYNPLAMLETRYDERKRTTSLLSGRATLTIIDGLKASVMGSWTQYNDMRNQYRERDSKSSLDDYRGGARAQKWFENDLRTTMEFQLDYSKVINEIHSLNVLAGHNYEYQVREGFDAWNSGFLTDAFTVNNLGNGTGIREAGTSYSNMGSFKWDDKLAGFFGRVNYVLMDKYQFSATVRVDGSSRFGRDKRWGTFPSISGGWVISQEEFMKDISSINNLKLRAGYGVTGNRPSDRYIYMTTLGTGGEYPVEGGTWYQTYGPARNPNPNLKWEEKRELNVGVDFSLLRDRLSGTFDVYQRRTVDLLGEYNAQLPPFVLNSLWTNVGEISNEGFEIGLSGKIITGSAFSWDASATFSHTKNTLISLSDDIYKATFQEYYGLPAPGALGNAVRSEEGKSLGGFYGKRFAGFDESGRWQFYNRFDEVVSLSEIVPDDYAYIGNGNPKFHASLTNTFRYKGLDLTIGLRGKFNYDILNLKELYFGNLNWLPNNVLTSATTTHAELRDAPQYSDYYLEDGSFVKLDDLTLGYTFKIKRNDYLRNLRVYVSGQNLATFTKYKGTTPELDDTGMSPSIEERSFYPVSSRVMFGINVGF